MTKHHTGTKASCDAVQAAANRLMGYPKTVTKGLKQDKDEAKLAANARLITGQEEFVERFVGEVEMPTYAKVRRHPTYSQFAYPITADLEIAYLDAGALALSVEDDELLFDAVDGAKDLPESWDPKEAKEIDRG